MRKMSKEYMAAWRAKNKAHVAAYGKKYAEEHKKERRIYMAAYLKDYAKKNHKKLLAYAQAWKKAHPEYLQYHRDYAVQNRERVYLANKEWAKNNSEKVRESKKKSYRKQPEKTNARKLLLRALERGVIKKENCVVCKSRDVEAHHPDYSQPLNVVWLCVTHHRALHRKPRLLPKTNKENN